MYARQGYAFRTYTYRSYARGGGGAGGPTGPANLAETLALADDFVAIMIYKATLSDALTLSDFESTVIRMPFADTITLLDSFGSRKGWIPEIPLPPKPWLSE